MKLFNGIINRLFEVKPCRSCVRRFVVQERERREGNHSAEWKDDPYVVDSLSIDDARMRLEKDIANSHGNFFDHRIIERTEVVLEYKCVQVYEFPFKNWT